MLARQRKEKEEGRMLQLRSFDERRLALSPLVVTRVPWMRQFVPYSCIFFFFFFNDVSLLRFASSFGVFRFFLTALSAR